MVHAGEYSEPLSYTARSDGNFRIVDLNEAARAADAAREVNTALLAWG